MSVLRLPPSFLVPTWSSKVFHHLLPSYRPSLLGDPPIRRPASWWTGSYPRDDIVKDGPTLGKAEDTEEKHNRHHDKKSMCNVSEVSASEF